MTSIFWHVLLGEQVMCPAVMAQHSLCPAQILTVSKAASARDAATCPHQPHLPRAQGEALSRETPQKKLKPLSFPSCQCAAGIGTWLGTFLLPGEVSQHGHGENSLGVARLTQQGSHACIKVPAWHNSSLVILEMSFWHK